MFERVNEKEEEVNGRRSKLTLSNFSLKKKDLVQREEGTGREEDLRRELKAVPGPWSFLGCSCSIGAVNSYCLSIKQ